MHEMMTICGPRLSGGPCFDWWQMNRNAKVDECNWNEDELGQSEILCLSLCANGFSTNEIAKKMNMAPSEIDGMLEIAQGKLKAKNRLHAISIAISSGLVRLV